MKYKVVAAKGEMALGIEVEKFLRDGWILQGGVSVSWNGLNAPIYAQALVLPSHE